MLAAGRGTRLNCDDEPKVMRLIGGRPIASFIVTTMKQVGLRADQICLVVGFKQEKVRDFFGDEVLYAEQSEQKGTAHAAFTGMMALPSDIKQVLVLNGDDSAFYRPDTLKNFIYKHCESRAILSLLTVETKSNTGKIVRHSNGSVEIIEKEYLTEEQKKITEISTGTFMLERAWFEKIFPTMPPLRKLGEYGLPTALAIARVTDEKYQVIKLSDPSEWHGINTIDELNSANDKKLKSNI